MPRISPAALAAAALIFVTAGFAAPDARAFVARLFDPEDFSNSCWEVTEIDGARLPRNTLRICFDGPGISGSMGCATYTGTRNLQAGRGYLITLAPLPADTGNCVSGNAAGNGDTPVPEIAILEKLYGLAPIGSRAEAPSIRVRYRLVNGTPHKAVMEFRGPLRKNTLSLPADTASPTGSNAEN